MKRVAYLTPLYFDEESYLGGGERYPLNLAKAVVHSGDYEVELVSYGDESTDRLVSLAEGVSLRVLPAARRKPDAQRLSWDIVEAVRDADLVHIHQVFSRQAEVGMLVAKLLGKPVCVSDHGGASSHLGRSLGILDLADRVTCYSEFGATMVPPTSTPIELVRGGVDDEFFHEPEERVARDRIVYAGRLLPHKGIDRLIAALPPDVPLTICGRPYHDDYHRLLRSLAVGKQVRFALSTDDVSLREEYRRALAVVLPSVYVDCYGSSHPWPELMGLTLLEGMACGAPAICSRVGGMPEFVEPELTGFVYDEIAELTSCLERLAAEPSLVARMGEAARDRVAASYGIEPVGAAMRAVYGQLIGEPVPA